MFFTVSSIEGHHHEVSCEWGGMRHLRAWPHNHVPGRLSEQNRVAHYQDGLRSETRRRQIAEDAAWRAGRRDWGVANGSPHGAYRRAIPLDSGDGKKKRLRANPRARIKTGADLPWLFEK